MDFNKIVNDIKKDQAFDLGETTTKTEPEYKFLYPFAQGRVVFRLLPNEKSNTVQRLISRHEIPDSTNQYGKKKVICRNFHYGKDCPICQAIREAQSVNGKDCDAFKKFGYKTRGIAYATIVEAPAEYDVAVGETVLFMFPKSVFNSINETIMKYASNVQQIFNDNDGVTFVLETKKPSNSFPEYAVALNLGLSGPVKYKVKETQAEYDAFINSLPNLNEAFVPETEPEDLYKIALASADLVKTTYGVVSEAKTTVNNSKGSLADLVADDFTTTATTTTTAAPSTTNSFDPFNVKSTNPQCFGCHKDGDMKCNLCPSELECMSM